MKNLHIKAEMHLLHLNFQPNNGISDTVIDFKSFNRKTFCTRATLRVSDFKTKQKKKKKQIPDFFTLLSFLHCLSFLFTFAFALVSDFYRY